MTSRSPRFVPSGPSEEIVTSRGFLLRRTEWRHTAIGFFLAVLPLSGRWARANELDGAQAPLETLFFHAQRYATTPEKKANKKRAREALFARKSEALAYLVSQAYVSNLWYGILAEQVARELKPDEAVPVLEQKTKSQHVPVRKLAAFLLGLYPAPADSTAVLTLLSDNEVARVAIRTLGKWRVREAVPRIIPFLRATDERCRIAAANALGEIGDQRAVPHLVEALHDPYFTVRRAAGRSLAALGEPAEQALLDALRTARGAWEREIVRTLGEMKAQRAVGALSERLTADENGLREDAVRHSA